MFGLKMTPLLLEVFHLLLLDVAHDHIVNHFLGLTQQVTVNPPPAPPPKKWGLMRMMTVFTLSLVFK